MELNHGYRTQKSHPIYLITFTFLGIGLLTSQASAFATPLPTVEVTTVAANTSSTVHSTMTSNTHPDSTTSVTQVPTTATPTKTIEACVPQVCEEKICRVNGSISRPSFYARCPSQSENEPNVDMTKYCMCASAYHASATEENQQFYVQIMPDSNCQVPESDEDKNHCEQSVCQGTSKKSNRLAHICQDDDKYYCGCFN